MTLDSPGPPLRTPRGRMATRNAYLHFGLPAPRREGHESHESTDGIKGTESHEEQGSLPLDLDSNPDQSQ